MHGNLENRRPSFSVAAAAIQQYTVMAQPTVWRLANDMVEYDILLE